MSRINIEKIVTTMIALTAWFALALQLYILVAGVPENDMSVIEAIGRFFIFFTILSNILVAFSLSILLISPKSVAARYFKRPSVITAVSVYIFIVGLVYNILLRSVWHPAGLQKIADDLLHVAVPVSFILYWIFFAPKDSLRWTHAFRWLIFPAIYLVYALLRGALEGFYPYPFINANELTFGRVFLNSFGLMFVFIVTGLLFIAVSKGLTMLKQNKTKTISDQ